MEWSENIAEALEDGCIRVDIRRGAEEDQRILSITGADVLHLMCGEGKK